MPWRHHRRHRHPAPHPPHSAGRLVHRDRHYALACRDAAGLLADAGIGGTVDPRWAAPVNPALAHLAARHRLALVVEDGIADGGIGTLIAHDCIRAGITTPVHALGLPTPFLPHGDRNHLLHRAGIAGPALADTARRLLAGHRLPERKPQHLPASPAKEHAMTRVNLSPPAPPAPVRRRTRQIHVGDVPVGGGAPVSIQSMTTTLTADINATLQQIAELTAAGCDIVRVAVPSQDDADALPAIARKATIPVIADIHFQPRYVFAAIDAGCAAVRVNPGNIKAFDDKVKEIAQAATAAGVPIRIGVNAGSLDKRLLARHGKATPQALVDSALWECSLFEEHGFTDLKLSVKHHDPLVMIAAYRLLADACDYPLHLGVTEAGPLPQGTVKSAVAFGVLLAEGIGDTIRVSLTAPPVEEVKAGQQILASLGLRERGLEIVSCPSCGRAQVDVLALTERVQAAFEGFPAPIRVAVMGCVVNGPGEAREADIGVASGNGKGQIFVRGRVVATVPESKIVERLLEEALRLTAQTGTGPA
jgi:(E)-4-hydroxy-3-methylbut-2-enyl-diphosphate synthase